jgi:hypothetical protein
VVDVPIYKLVHYLLTFLLFVVDVPIYKLAHYLFTFLLFVTDVPINKVAHLDLTFSLDKSYYLLILSTVYIVFPIYT